MSLRQWSTSLEVPRLVVCLNNSGISFYRFTKRPSCTSRVPAWFQLLAPFFFVFLYCRCAPMLGASTCLRSPTSFRIVKLMAEFNDITEEWALAYRSDVRVFCRVRRALEVLTHCGLCPQRCNFDFILLRCEMILESKRFVFSSVFECGTPSYVGLRNFWETSENRFVSGSLLELETSVRPAWVFGPP